MDGYKAEETAASIDEEKVVLGKFTDMSKTGNFTPVLLLIPFKEQLNQTMLLELAARRNITMDNLNVTKTNREWASVPRLVVLDPLAYMEKYDIASLYWRIDHHLNLKGNEVLAQYMHDELTRRQLVPVSQQAP